MSTYSGPVDVKNRVVLEPRIQRAYWSERHAWKQQEVRLVVEAEHVPDDAVVALRVWKDNAEHGAPDDFIVEVQGPHHLKRGRLSVKHKITWDQPVLRGDPLRTPRFYFVAEIAAYGLLARSTVMTADFRGYRVSG